MNCQEGKKEVRTVGGNTFARRVRLKFYFFVFFSLLRCLLLLIRLLKTLIHSGQ